MEPDFGTQLARWMEAKQVTVPELAKQIGITKAAIYQWIGVGESKTSPTMANAELALGALDLTWLRFWGPIPKAAKSRARAS